MKKAYTFVDTFKNKILVRTTDSEDIITEVDFELYLKSNKEVNSHSLYGDPLKRMDFPTIKEFNTFKSDMKNQGIPVFGMDSPVYQYISNNYGGVINFDPNDFRILLIDIENLIPEDGTFAGPMEAKEPVTVITMKLLGQATKHVILWKEGFVNNSKDVQLHQVKDESELLIKFIDLFCKMNPHGITGYNSKTYDITYMVNRINRVHSKKHSSLLSPFRRILSNDYEDLIKVVSPKSDMEDDYIQVKGVVHLDYMEIYKHFSLVTLDSYKLDRVCEVELSEKKVDYSGYKDLNDLFHNNFQLYVEYNIHDVELVERLENKLHFIKTIYTVAYDGKINWDDVFSQTRFWDSKIYNTLRERGIQIPPKMSFPDVSIDGGFVKDPRPNLYKNVVSFDLNSLYPSIMQMLNMSPDTIRQSSTGDFVEDFAVLKFDNSKAIRDDLTVASNGSMYIRDVRGIIPELLKVAYEDRVKSKNEMLRCRKEAERVKALMEKEGATPELKKEKEKWDDLAIYYNCLQSAKKISLNSAYGACACKYFRYFNTSIAEGITRTGQSIIKFIEKRINIFLNEKFKVNEDWVIISDTDSIAICLNPVVERIVPVDKRDDQEAVLTFLLNFSDKVLAPLIDESYKEFEIFVNAYESKLVMKMENICSHSFIRAKKNYIMNVLWSEGVKYKEAKMKMMGIETARSSTPQFVKDALIECYKIMMFKDQKTLHDYTHDFKKKYFNTPIELLAVPRGISDMDKWMTGELTYKSGTPIHVKAAMVYNYLVSVNKLGGSNPPMKNGSKCRFFYLKNNPLHFEVAAFVDTLPPEFGLHPYIDYDKMYEKTFVSPVNSFAKIINWSPEKVNNLDFLFG